MVKYVSITFTLWVALMATQYKLLSKMVSENPMIPYMIGTLYMSILLSLFFYLTYSILKLVKEMFAKGNSTI